MSFTLLYDQDFHRCTFRLTINLRLNATQLVVAVIVVVATGSAALVVVSTASVLSSTAVSAAALFSPAYRALWCTSNNRKVVT